MKKLFALSLVFCVPYICWKSLQPVAESSLIPIRRPTLPKVDSPPAQEQTHLNNPAKDNLTSLSEELAQLDHEIARAGYPEVMSDERLSEDEREELISKVLKSTRLFDRIMRLRVASREPRDL